jgi:putative glycerol-1-phosphate prenyltransferase
VNIYQNILSAKAKNQKLLAVLIDPEKMVLTHVPSFIKKVQESIATHIFVGGSTDQNNGTRKLISVIKEVSSLPVILFPGDLKQITTEADGILFLSLLSGRNPEYLIGQQVRAVPLLKNTNLEIIPTGYILIDGQKVTATQRVSNTKPIPQNALNLILNTALAGQFSGKKLIYLEAGSGAVVPVAQNIIQIVESNLTVPLLVGGGIRSKEQLETAFNAGADMVVIGTAFEENESFFLDLKKNN